MIYIPDPNFNLNELVTPATNDSLFNGLVPVKDGCVPTQQGNVTNLLTLINSRSVTDYLSNSEEYTVEMKNTNCKVQVKVSLDISNHWTETTSMLLDIIVSKRANLPGKPLKLTLLLKEYMEARGLSDRKSAKQRLEADLNTLVCSRVTWEQSERKEQEENNEKTKKHYKTFTVLDNYENTNYSTVYTLEFSKNFIKLLDIVDCHYTDYPILLFRINPKENPHAYSMLRKAWTLNRTNLPKSNDEKVKNGDPITCISTVETFLDSAIMLPNYAELVDRKNYHLIRDIITPFEKGMDYGDFLDWCYIDDNNEPLSEQDQNNLYTDYDLFRSARIMHSLTAQPDQTDRIENRIKGRNKKLKEKAKREKRKEKTVK